MARSYGAYCQAPLVQNGASRISFKPTPEDPQLAKRTRLVQRI